MVNIWATWCGNCVNELTALAEMNRRLADKNVAVIGICTDADTRPDECKALIADHEVDYLNLMPIDGLDETLEIPGLPTSYFIDSEGKIMCVPFIGAPHEMSPYDNAEEGTIYTVHVMKFPEGYVPNAEEYKTTETYCDVCIVLQKQ